MKSKFSFSASSIQKLSKFSSATWVQKPQKSIISQRLFSTHIPKIGITPSGIDQEFLNDPVFRGKADLISLKRELPDFRLEENLKIQPNEIRKIAEAEMSKLDGLIIAGSQTGIDKWFVYKDRSLPENLTTPLAISIFKIAMAKTAIEQRKPVFASCNGKPHVTALSGGTIIPINQIKAKTINGQTRTVTHLMPTNPSLCIHDVYILPDTWLYEIALKVCKTTSVPGEPVRIIGVSSTHPYVSENVPNSVVLARAPDGSECITQYFVPQHAIVMGDDDHPESGGKVFISSIERGEVSEAELSVDMRMKEIYQTYMNVFIKGLTLPKTSKPQEYPFDSRVMELLHCRDLSSKSVLLR